MKESCLIVGRTHLPKIWRRRILLRVRRLVRNAGLDRVFFSVNFVNDPMIIALNHRWRGQKRSTDVLSFAAAEDFPDAGGGARYLGDLVISVDNALDQARRFGHRPDEEIAALIAHGLLHLMGFDHEHSRSEAQTQCECEMSFLASAGIDPKVALLGRTI